MTARGVHQNGRGNPGTGKLLTGQRLTGTGLCHHGARYVDPGMQRVVIADGLDYSLRLKGGYSSVVSRKA